MSAQIDEISVDVSTNGERVTIPVPYCANTSDREVILRAYVATQWMNVTDVFSVHVAERPHSWPTTVLIARLRVDNNGGEPFDADVDVVRAHLRALAR